ncbi:TPM domain-containing protein [Anabaena sp. CCY 0017]|uniref:TPM domain-containing protein n=1 Tax=Anabaena sp. CCY 0017 TaxID=3103866 RepID=UPI0039C6CE3F
MKFNFLKPRRIFWLSIRIFFAVLLLFPLSGLALKVQEVPTPRQESGDWVTDMAGILSNETEAQINLMISDLEAKNGTEMAVVTVPTTSPAVSPKAFATELFNHWGIGKKGQDNGVLFLISVGDRRVEIETGYALEAILPDARVGNIINSQIIPEFKKGDFAGGTLAGTKALVLVLESDPDQVATLFTTEVTPNNSRRGVFAGIIGGGIFTLFVGSIFLQIRQQRLPPEIFLKKEGSEPKKPVNYRIFRRNYKFLCADCEQPMRKVDTSRIESHLSKEQKVAQNIGSVKFEGWECLHCQQVPTGKGFNLIGFDPNSSRFPKCYNCQEFTIIRTEKTIKKPTQRHSGIQQIIEKCHCCDYYQESEITISPLPPPRSRGSSSSSYTGGDYSSGNSYSGGDCSSGGGSDYGGGSSGGGGAGDSW